MEMSAVSLTGDPESILVSAGHWSAFSSVTSSVAGDIRRIDADGFRGDEAELYRQTLTNELPPHLETTSDAWGIVGAALRSYATTLEGLQDRMSALSGLAAEQQREVDSAGHRVAEATTADRRYANEASATAHPTGPPADNHQTLADAASTRLHAADLALQATNDAGDRIHGEHRSAVDTCVTAIDRACGLRFEEPPGFWGRLKNSVVGWIADHADVLKTISSVLKTISGIAGMLAMIPVLSPLMGPIALAAGGGALVLDSAVKVVTGEGSWGDILLDGALMVLPGAGKALKGAVLSTKSGRAADYVAAAALTAVKDSKAGRAVAAVRNSKVGNVLAAPGKGLDWVNTKVADGLGHVPGANRLPGVKLGPGVTAGDVERAEAARDAAGLKANGTRDRKYAAFVAGMKDGRIVIGRAQPGSLIHAEDDALAQLPGATLTKAYGWRSNRKTGEIEWTERPVCHQCQTHLSRDQFVSDVNAEPGGVWGR